MDTDCPYCIHDATPSRVSEIGRTPCESQCSEPAGAIEACVGAALCRAGVEVHLIARGPQLDALRQCGVQVLSDRGDFAEHPHATDDPRDIGEVDYVFLGLKAHSYARAGALLFPPLGPQTAIVAVQNETTWWYFHKVAGPYEGRWIEAV